ncbi:DUF47 family protein [Eubacteriales bacterium OttesenSCG-928-M02]|nr:DUF47 family protein [Eubacteriales bacterium OttesenSCG-928-M02]
MAKKVDYFQLFVDMAQTSLTMAESLMAYVEDFNPDVLEKSLEELHKVENLGDIQRHDLLRALTREFVTPIEREDISAIANAIDDVTDAVEDILIKIYMFDIKEILPHAISFTQNILVQVRELHALFLEFPKYKRSQSLQSSLIEINRLEEECDALYTLAIRQLYTSDDSPLFIQRWFQLYTCMEDCADTVEEAAELVETVIMKNS